MRKIYQFLCKLSPEVRYQLYELSKLKDVSQNALIIDLITTAAAENGIVVPQNIRTPKTKRNNLRTLYRPQAAPDAKPTA